MTDQPRPMPADNDDDRKPRARVDPDDVRKALDEQAKKRPPRPPATEMRPPIPPLRVYKPIGRRRRKP